MKGSLLEKYSASKPSAETVSAIEEDTLDDLGSFGWLRGIRDRAVMLELRRRDGSITALGYAWLKKASFDPSGDILLDFSGEIVKIAGRNLNVEARPNVRLLAGIVRHRVPWIQEAGGPDSMEAPRDATVIEQFEIK